MAAFRREFAEVPGRDHCIIRLPQRPSLALRAVCSRARSSAAQSASAETRANPVASISWATDWRDPSRRTRRAREYGRSGRSWARLWRSSTLSPARMASSAARAAPPACARAPASPGWAVTGLRFRAGGFPAHRQERSCAHRRFALTLPVRAVRGDRYCPQAGAPVPRRSQRTND